VKSDSAIRFGKQIPASTDLGRHDQHRHCGSRPADPRCGLRHQLHPVARRQDGEIDGAALSTVAPIAVSIGSIFNAMPF
jgi:hypothetical protein